MPFHVYRILRDYDGDGERQFMVTLDDEGEARELAREWNQDAIREGRRSGTGQQEAYEVVAREIA